MAFFSGCLRSRSLPACATFAPKRLPQWRSYRATVETLDPNMVKMKYAVRGSVVDKAAEMKQRLADGEALPFTELVPCNIGNPHAVRQKPITFYRQVAACCLYPELMELEGNQMPEDVISRAKEYLAGTGGNGIGSYTDSAGLALVRRQVADFIERRDGYPCDPDKLQITSGASEGVKRCLAALLTEADKTDAVMIPCPQYPLYSAEATMSSGEIVYYELDESKNWSVTRSELDRAFGDAAQKGFVVRAIAVINPGNPSGAVLSYEDVKMIITFAKDRGVVILADEVYQENIYDETKKFHSFKKVLFDLMSAGKGYSDVQLISFHSNSKGLIGECGTRGGYAEFVNFDAATMGLFTKVASTSLSSNTLGQIFCGLMVTPPKEGDPSYHLFKEERDGIFSGMKRRAKLLEDGLNEIEGISCARIEGAMYGFPSLMLPDKAVAKAKQMGIDADEYWCLRLVEETGIVCVPGSGFGQKDGTFHFRITILPPDEMLEGMLGRLKSFQESFLNEFR